MPQTVFSKPPVSHAVLIGGLKKKFPVQPGNAKSQRAIGIVNHRRVPKKLAVTATLAPPTNRRPFTCGSLASRPSTSPAQGPSWGDAAPGAGCPGAGPAPSSPSPPPGPQPGWPGGRAAFQGCEAGSFRAGGGGGGTPRREMRQEGGRTRSRLGRRVPQIQTLWSETPPFTKCHGYLEAEKDAGGRRRKPDPRREARGTGAALRPRCPSLPVPTTRTEPPLAWRLLGNPSEKQGKLLPRLNSGSGSSSPHVLNLFWGPPGPRRRRPRPLASRPPADRRTHSSAPARPRGLSDGSAADPPQGEGTRRRLGAAEPSGPQGLWHRGWRPCAWTGRRETPGPRPTCRVPARQGGPSCCVRSPGLEPGGRRERRGATSRTGSRGRARARASGHVRRGVERVPDPTSTCPGQGARMLCSTGRPDTRRPRGPMEPTGAALGAAHWTVAPRRRPGGEGSQRHPPPLHLLGRACLPGRRSRSQARFGLDRGSKPGPYVELPGCPTAAPRTVRRGPGCLGVRWAPPAPGPPSAGGARTASASMSAHASRLGETAVLSNSFQQTESHTK